MGEEKRAAGDRGRRAGQGSFAAAVFTYGVGVVLGQAVGLVLLPVYAHFLAPDAFGIFEVLSRSRDAVWILFSTALSVTTISFFQFEDTPREKHRAVGTAFWFQWGLAALVLVVVAPLATSLAQRALPAPEPVLLALLTLAVTVADIAQIVPLALWQARIQAGRYVFFSVLMPLCRGVLVVIVLAVLDLGLVGLFAAWAINSAVFAVVLNALLLVQLEPGSLRPRRDLVRAMARFGLPFLPNSIMSFVLNSGDRYFLLHYGSAELVGLYGFGYRIGTLLEMGLLMPFAKVWNPVVMRMSQDDGGRTSISRLGNAFFFVYGGAMVALMMIAHEVVDVLAPDDYLESIVFVPFVIMAYYFFAATLVFDASIYVKRRTEFKPIITTVAVAVILVGYWLLIPRYGGIGAAVATGIASLTMAVLAGVVGRRLYPIPYRYHAPLLIPVVVALCVVPVYLRYGLSAPIPLPVKLAAIGGYVAAAVVLRFVRWDELFALVRLPAVRREESGP
jgi:O-antigen/teichoic acid export membrane protein